MADNIRATSQNATLGAIANFLKQTYAPQRTQQMQGVMELLGVPALARTAERMSYGEPVTNINKANVPLLPADTAEAAMLAGPPLASMARRVGTNLVQTAPYVARDLAQSMTSPMRSYVVKPKGGNWLAGSVERSIEPMKTRVIGQDPASRLRDLDAAYAQNVEAGVAMDPAVFARERARLEPEVAMNRWLESKLGKYIKNEMATPEDPLRALAERGVMHYEPSPTGYSIAGPRVAAGFPEEGMGVSDLAKTWEGRADTFVNTLKASDMTGYYPKSVEENPWLLKVPPETPVYEMLSGAGDDLGFRHLADELKNAINPESGLPANLRLKYSDLEKVTVPQAVERVAKINEWRAAQKAEADMARAMGPATQVVKEYPEQGFKWVELRKPKETGKKVDHLVKPDEIADLDDVDVRAMFEDMAEDEGFVRGTREFEEFIRDMTPQSELRKVDESYKALEDALKYEGETMGHCVGGYCSDVVAGRSKIYSLRDKKGQPHVTIEVRPDIRPRESYYGEPQDEIVQIKGKANRAPNPEYLPAVQDFVRSGNFGKIGDLKNAGLVQLPDKRLITNEQFDEGIQRMTGEGEPSINAEWFQRQIKNDPSWWENAKDAFEGFSQGGQVRGYAEGGQVSGANFPTGDFDPARIDTIVGELHALNAG